MSSTAEALRPAATRAGSVAVTAWAVHVPGADLSSVLPGDREPAVDAGPARELLGREGRPTTPPCGWPSRPELPSRSRTATRSTP